MVSRSVAAIIPTIGRNSLLAAVESALGQARVDIEVLVIVDGSPDDAHRIKATLPPATRVMATGARSNANIARNLGIKAAQTDFVALLDDDDLWCPDKVWRQLRDAEQRSLTLSNSWLSVSRFALVGQFDGEVWPSRFRHPGEDLGDYLFRRDTLRREAKGYQTSTWLGPRSMFLEHPFAEDRSVHQDWDWLLRAAQVEGFEVVEVNECLSTYAYATSNSISRDTKWLESLTWISDESLTLSPRARGDFILSLPLALAARTSSPRSVRSVWDAAFREGRPGLPAISVDSVRVGLGAVNRLRGKLRGWKAFAPDTRQNSDD